MSKTDIRVCGECAKRLEATMASDAIFCCRPCKDRWNNRRKLRGAELYDAFMAYRFQRGTAKLLGLWSLICRMASMWKAEDDLANRQSYADPALTKMRLAPYAAQITRTL